jgi:hypothetical protein
VRGIRNQSDGVRDRRGGRHYLPAHRHGREAVDGGVVAELSLVVAPPAAHAAGRCQDAGVLESGGYRHGIAGSESHGCRHQAVAAKRAVHLAEVVASPTKYIAEQRAVVVASRRQRNRVDDADDAAFGVRGRSRAVAELAEAVIAPAMDPAGAAKRARVGATRGHGCDIHKKSHSSSKWTPESKAGS